MDKAVALMMHQAVADGVFPGAVLLVSWKGEIRFHRGFGVADIHTGERVTVKSIFDLASLTKPLATALSVMNLVEKKCLSLNMAVGEILSDAKGTDIHAVSVDQLLRHTSGLPAHRPYYAHLFEEWADEVLKRDCQGVIRRLILQEPLIARPGEKQLYSDLGYMILCWIIETVTGGALDKYADKELYAPMGIKDLFFVKLLSPSFSKSGLVSSCSPSPDSSDSLNLSSNDLQRFKSLQNVSRFNHWDVSHFVSTEICPWRGKTMRGEVHDDNAWIAGGVEGHAGLFGTALGVWQIVKGMMVPTEEKDSLNHNVLNSFLSGGGSGKMVAGFDTPSLKGSSAGKYFSSKSIGHLGFTGTSFWMDPEKELIVVLLTNRVHPRRNNDKIKQFRPRIHDLIVEHLGLEN